MKNSKKHKKNKASKAKSSDTKPIAESSKRKRKAKALAHVDEESKPKEPKPVESLEPVLEPGSATRKPPDHVTGHHVYSSAYRKAHSQGLDVEGRRQAGKDAAAYFNQTGLVDDRCGVFRAQPRAAKAPKNQAEPGDQAPKNQDLEVVDAEAEGPSA